LVEREVFHTPSGIALFASKSLLSQNLFNEYGDDPMELLKGEQLNKEMDKFMPLCSLNICNFITSFKKPS
jgi:hypothetical protein